MAARELARTAPATRTPLLQQREAGCEEADHVGLSGRVRTGFHDFDVLFCSANRLLDLGNDPDRTLTEDDSEDLLPTEHPGNARDALLAAWRARERRGRPSLMFSIWDAWWPLFIGTAVLHLIEVVLNFGPAPFIRPIVEVIDSEEPNIPLGLLYAAGFFMSPFLQSVFMCHFIIHCRRVGMRTWGATSCMVFEKVLRLSQPAAASYGPGSLTNIMQVDTGRFDFAFFHLNFIWSMPVMLVLGMVMLFRNLGWASLTPLLLMGSMYPLNTWLVKQLMKLSRENNKSRDARIKILTEVLHAVRLVKMLGWEQQIAELVERKRDDEMAKTARFKIFDVLNGLVWQGVPMLLPLMTFGVYVLGGGELDPGLVFSTMALLDMVRIPMNLIPQALQVVVQVKVGMDRIQRLLEAEEVVQRTPAEAAALAASGADHGPLYVRGSLAADGQHDGGWEPNSSVAAKVSRAAFHWADAVPIDDNADGEENEKKCSEGCYRWLRRSVRSRVAAPPAVDGSMISLPGTSPATLRVPSLEIPAGKLVFVCGPVGAGKSTLMAGLLNEIPLLHGRVDLCGPIAYCSQKPWILHGTVMDNVLCGEEYDPVRFAQVVRACALEADLKELRDGADTVIGERGINLSGGQKARIGLARAAYKHPSTFFYLLDDPLSAVDMHVAAHLMEECLGPAGLLRHTTRVLVTHQLQYMSKADLVIVVQGGAIAACRPPSEFSAKELDAFHLNPDEGPQASPTASSITPHAQPPAGRLDALSRPPASAADEVSALVPSFLPPCLLPWQDAWSQHMASSPYGLPRAPRLHPLNRRRTRHVPQHLLRAISDEAGGDAADAQHAARPAASRARTEPERSTWWAPQREDRAPLRPSTSKERVPEEAPEDLEAPAAAPPAEQRNRAAPAEEEERQIGALDLDVWLMYAKAMGKSIAALLLLVILLSNLLQLVATYWLGQWSSRPEEASSQTWAALSIYALLSMAALFFLTSRMLLFRWVSLTVSRDMHRAALWAVLRSPMAWLDTTPSGRIVNRFSQDMQKLDNDAQGNISGFVDNLVNLAMSCVVVAVYVPLLVVIVLPVLYLYHKVQNRFRVAAIELQRLASRSKSPIFQGLDEAIIGVASIRAFENQAYFIERNVERTSVHLALNFNIMVCNRWLCVRLRAVGTIPIAVVAIFLVVQARVHFMGLAITGAAAGLVLRYALNFSMMMEGFLQSVMYTELCLVAIERISEFTQLPPEADLVLQADEPAQAWPTVGEVVFQDVVMRYRPDLPTVLNSISFTVPGGTSVGVVGRTGAGKSSLLQALFRMCPLTGGHILIDGVDISTVGLHTLRRRLAIIPQDPVGFTGSLRFNLDPFNERHEAELWEKLKQVQLADFVRSKEEGLDFNLTAGGENLSVGQMQLACAARAFLRNARILILDEATASVDFKTDSLIQRVLREEVVTRKLTTVTIAHRINTIMGADNVLVMARGTKAEFGPPRVLAEDPRSIFYTFVHAAHKSNAAVEEAPAN